MSTCHSGCLSPPHLTQASRRVGILAHPYDIQRQRALQYPGIGIKISLCFRSWLLDGLKFDMPGGVASRKGEE